MSINKQDIVSAILNSDTFLKVPELQGAKPRLNKNGSLFAFVGGFNMVFQLEHQNKKWAFRVWHVPMGEHKDRYRKISQYLTDKKLPYFADFIYDEKGILVNGNFIDTIRMEWLEGSVLKEYIEGNLGNKDKLTKLANDFLEMCKTMRDNKISHGDLQEGNILIDRNGNIKLVDYDSICIPDIEGQKELVTGLKGYQHPSRFKATEASLKADYFSELIIYISILAISESSDFWQKYQVKDTQYLLFKESDFEQFEISEIYNDLIKLSDKIKSLVRILKNYLHQQSYLELEPIDFYFTPPIISKIYSDEEIILEDKSTIIHWKIENADLITIDKGIGDVSASDEVSVNPKENTTYTIKAKNTFGCVEEKIEIQVLPKPKINKFKSQRSKLEYGKSIDIEWNIEHASSVKHVLNGITEDVDLIGSKKVSPTEHTTYELQITALDNETVVTEKVYIEVYKPVKINSFKSDLEHIMETIPITLSWDIEHATTIYIEDNKGRITNIDNENEITLEPDKTVKYYKIIADNQLNNNAEKLIKIQVDARSSVPLNFPKIELPKMDLSFTKDFFNKIQLNPDEAFKDAKKTRKPIFSLKKIVDFFYH